MSESAQLKTFLETLSLPEHLAEISTTEPILEQHKSFENLSTSCCDYINYMLPGDPPESLLSELLTWTKEKHGTEFTDTFCFHLINEIFTVKAKAVFAHTCTMVFDGGFDRSKRKLLNIFPDLTIPEEGYADFRKIIFENAQREDSMKALEMLLDYYSSDGGYKDVLWNSLEIKEIIEKATSEHGENTVYKKIADSISRPFFFGPHQDPSFITGQLERYLINYESAHGQNDFNTIRSPQRYQPAKTVFADPQPIKNGNRYLTTGAFFAYRDLLGTPLSDRENLNKCYNRLNRDISYILASKMGIADFELTSDFFNIRPGEEMIEELTLRLSYRKIRQNLADKLNESFERSLSEQLCETCLDYLSLAYYRIHCLNQNGFNIAQTAENKAHLLEKLDEFNLTGPAFSSRTATIDLADNDPQLITDLIEKYPQITQVTLLERSYDLRSLKLTEKIKISFSEQEQILAYTASVPLRYYNLLCIDIHIFDHTGFTFLWRELDFQLGNLSKNTTDLLLRHALEGLGLISEIIFDGTGEASFEKALFLYDPPASLIPPNFQLQQSPTSEAYSYFRFLQERASIPAETKRALSDTFETIGQSNEVFTSDPSLADLLDKVYQQSSNDLYQAMVEAAGSANAYYQAQRLNEIPTPGDLALWVSKEEREAISEKNDRRSGLINHYLRLNQSAKDKTIDLIEFLPVFPGISGVLLPCFSICDFKANKITSICRVFSSLEPRPWYMQNIINVDENLIQALYLLKHSRVNAYQKYGVDLSDLSDNGLQYSLDLYNYLEDPSQLENKFRYHCLLPTFTPPSIGKEVVTPSEKKAKITNPDIEKCVLLSKYILSKEKEFIAKLLGPKFRLTKKTAIELGTYKAESANSLSKAQNDAVDTFNASFFPVIDRWNDEEYYSITVGMGSSTYLVFTYSSTAYNIFVPMASIQNSHPRFHNP